MPSPIVAFHKRFTVNDRVSAAALISNLYLGCGANSGNGANSGIGAYSVATLISKQ